MLLVPCPSGPALPPQLPSWHEAVTRGRPAGGGGRGASCYVHTHMMLRHHGFPARCWLPTCAAPCSAGWQVLVWKTNFDRYLEDAVAPIAQQGPGARAGALFGSPMRAPAAAGAPSAGQAALPAHEVSLAGGLAEQVLAAQHPQASSSGPGMAPPVLEAGVPVTAVPRSRVEALASYSWEAAVPPPLNLSDLPPSLAATLSHMVGQLDVLTQTLALMDERLTRSEDTLSAMDERVDALARSAAREGGAAGAGKGGPAGGGLVDTALPAGGADQWHAQ